MSRPPHARENVLDAYQSILIANGERAATMDATARDAGVSKGGLLYHFASKDSLENGLIDRLHVLVDADILAMTTAPEGPIAYFLRSSAMESSPLDHAIIAVSRLAQGGNAQANTTLREIRTRWGDVIRPHAKDEASLDLIMLVGDGLYYNNALQGGGAIVGPVPQGATMDALITLVLSATQR